jgi:hypothetical protein
MVLNWMIWRASASERGHIAIDSYGLATCGMKEAGA